MVKSNYGATRKCHKTFDTDVAARNIWLSLVRDFRSTEGPSFARGAEEAFLSGVTEYRDYIYPELGTIPAHRFKRWKQLEGLLKKYRFADDKYTDEELERLTLDKFFSDQARLATYEPIGPLCHMVLQCARKHAKRILGKYDPDMSVTAARFGKKSSIGCPLSLAYIDHKLTDLSAFTGSTECSKWFYRNVLPDDPILSGLVDELGVTTENHANLLHESLTLVNVPKSWKTHRPITPLTLIALFYSYGVGEQVTQRLVMEGLDISRLQQRHRRLVEWLSLPENLSKGGTADLSNASNSILSWLLNRVLPREWYCAIKKTFQRKLTTPGGGSTYYTESVLPMGNGLTFPVETLVFYCILKAIAELAKVKGLISVYGDDLIYPTRLHRYVAVIFPKLKFQLNLDKTFMKADFRESCGTDFYRGADVRPAYLPDAHSLLNRSMYQMWLYKTYNSLTRRWDPLEISGTLRYLLTEMSRVGHELFRVPPSFPDTAGIKVDHPQVIPMDAEVLPWAPIYLYCDGGLDHTQCGSWYYHFRYLEVRPGKRAVKAQLPYYWLALQGLDDETPVTLSWDNIYSESFALTRSRYAAKLEAPRTPLQWRTLKRVRWRTGKNGRKYRKTTKQSCAYTTSRRIIGTGVGKTRPDSVSVWI